MTTRLSERADKELLDLEDQLMSASLSLAAEIAKPADERDAEAIHRGWQAIAGHQLRYQLITKRLEAHPAPDRRKMKRAEAEDAQKRQDLARLSRKRLRDWDRIGRMVLSHVDPLPRTLIDWDLLSKPPDEITRMLDIALHAAIKSPEQDPDAAGYMCFPDIAFPARGFDQLVSAAYRLLLVQGRARDGRFLDVGCGAGSRCYLASRYFGRCDGVEYDPGYVESARRFFSRCGDRHLNVIHADGITFDRYHEYDVIYYYRPLRDDAVLARLERQILTNARPGTVILAPYTPRLVHRKLNPDIDVAVAEASVLIAGVSQEEATQMHTAALHTSIGPVPSVRDWAYDPGFWAPLIEASSRESS